MTFTQDKDITLHSETIQTRNTKSSAPQRSTSISSLGTLIITTNYGTTKIGTLNNGDSHNNSLPWHYFNKGIAMNGTLSSYSTLDLKLQTLGVDRMFIKQNGNVGIGLDPGTGTNLLVYGLDNPNIQLKSPKTHLQIGVATYDGAFAGSAKTGDAIIRQLGNADGHSGLILSLPSSLGDGKSYIKFSDEKYGAWFAIFNNKTVRIDGTVYATEINVKTDVWSDFVFSKDYKLRSLDEVEEYINTNNCLPDVPSEAEVKESGVDVAKMNAILLQKVEELTLYVIKQQEEIKELKNKVDSKK